MYGVICCPKCRFVTAVDLKFKTKKCIKCNKSTKVVKLVSAPGFRLKGGGWYETDFKSGSKKNIHDSENKMTKTGKKEN